MWETDRAALPTLGLTPDDLMEPAPLEGDADGPDGPLVRIFGDGLTGFVDGAVVDIAAARLLVRGMLRDGERTPGWCRLESPDLTVHVGWDVYMFITTSRPCPEAVRSTAAAGLFPQHWPGEGSPYAPEPAEDGLWPSMHTPIDDAFWARVDALVHEHGAVLVEEDAAWTRWHRVTPDDPRPTLRPRCRVLVWPDLATDLTTVFSYLDRDDPDDLDGTVIWQAPDGRVHWSPLYEDTAEIVREHLAGAALASWRSGFFDDFYPLIEAVMPDEDGVIRARWEPLTLQRTS